LPDFSSRLADSLALLDAPVCNGKAVV